jgi:hypothetical protein
VRISGDEDTEKNLLSRGASLPAGQEMVYVATSSVKGISGFSVALLAGSPTVAALNAGPGES